MSKLMSSLLRVFWYIDIDRGMVLSCIYERIGPRRREFSVLAGRVAGTVVPVLAVGVAPHSWRPCSCMDLVMQTGALGTPRN